MNHHKTKNIYPYKHWLSSLMLAPLFLMIEDFHNSFANSLQMYLLFSFFGLLFSLPVFVVYVFIFHLLIKTQLQPFVIKAISNILAISGVYITFKVIGGSSLDIKMAYVYWGAIFLTSFFYQIEPDKGSILKEDEDKILKH